MAGVMLREDEWEPLYDAEASRDWMFPIEALAYGDHDPEFSNGSTTRNAARLIDELPIAGVLIYRYWQERRRGTETRGSGNRRMLTATARKSRRSGSTSEAVHDGAGARILAQCEALAACSESAGALTRRYLTPQHRDAASLIAGWMRDAGMLPSLDALGNVVGRLEAATPADTPTSTTASTSVTASTPRDAPAHVPLLVTGSHMDSVVNAGRYDGIFGILCAIGPCARCAGRGAPPAVRSKSWRSATRKACASAFR